MASCALACASVALAFAIMFAIARGAVGPIRAPLFPLPLRCALSRRRRSIRCRIVWAPTAPAIARAGRARAQWPGRHLRARFGRRSLCRGGFAISSWRAFDQRIARAPPSMTRTRWCAFVRRLLSTGDVIRTVCDVVASAALAGWRAAPLGRAEPRHWPRAPMTPAPMAQMQRLPLRAGVAGIRRFRCRGIARRAFRSGCAGARFCRLMHCTGKRA